MSPDQEIILALKIAETAALVATLAFIVQYTLLAPWWRNPIGRTIVWIDALLAAALAPAVFSLYFHFNRFTSLAAGWVDAGIIFLIAAGMTWRMVVWQRYHRARRGKGAGLPGG